MEGDRLQRLPHLTCTHFYPRPPGGGRLVDLYGVNKATSISIHALQVEGDALPVAALALCRYFYPRPPGGGRLRRGFAPHPP